MQNKKTIWEFFIEKYKFTLLVILFLAIFGVISVFQMQKESMPEVDIPYAVVMTVYPGANSQDVEELVTQPLEDKIKSLDDVDEMSSESKNSISMITVQFDVNSDAQEKMNDLKDRIDEVKNDLPEDAQEPKVIQIRVDDVPILTFSVSGPYDRVEMKRNADQVKAEIERISGVSKVDIIGGQEEEIKVVVDKAKLDNYGFSLLQVSQAIQIANSDIPTGSIESSGINYSIRFSGRLLNVQDVQNIPLGNIGDVPILLKDVANVYSGYTDISTMSRLSKNGEQPQLAVSLNLYKTSGADTTKIVDEVLLKLEKIKLNYSEDLRFEISKNVGQDIKDDLSNLLINGFETVAIVVILLFLFLGWREALLAGISVPLTFLISFVYLKTAGYTLNFLTLFALILSLGILVDNAIVIAESIYVKMKNGLNVKQACIKSIKEYQWALIAGTLTTVFAFLPLLTVSGIIGKFIVSLPVTITAILLASLFVALGLIPVIAVLIFKEKENDSKEERLDSVEKKKSKKDYYMDVVNKKYTKIIASFLDNRKKSNKLLKYIGLALVLSIALPVTGVLKADMFPTGNEPKVYMDFKMPVGTPLEITNEKIKEVENILLEDGTVDSFLVTVGSHTSGGSIVSADASGNTHYAGVVVNLNKKSKGSEKFIADYDNKIKEIGGFVCELNQDVMGPPSEDPISISVEGNDLMVLDSISQQIKNIVENIPGTRSVRFTVESSPGEFVLQVDRVKAQIYGISTAQIASTLRNAVAGVDATVIRKNGEEIDVLVKYDLDGLNDGVSEKKIDLNNIESITIASQQGDIPLSSFIKKDLQHSRSLIQHDDGERIVKVVGDIKKGNSMQTIFATAKKEIEKNIELPENYKIIYGGESEDMQKSFSDIFRALLIGIFLIAALLVLQFNSYKQPLFILSTIPLSLIGVLPGLVLMGQPLSFPGAIGVVALMGIVVKNGIILIESVNNNRKDGMELREAIIEAGNSRLRPIILTTITTVMGMVPLAMSDPTWGPLGYAIIFGLSFSTVLTLFILPVICYRFSKA